MKLDFRRRFVEKIREMLVAEQLLIFIHIHRITVAPKSESITRQQTKIVFRTLKTSPDAMPFHFPQNTRLKPTSMLSFCHQPQQIAVIVIENFHPIFALASV